MRKRLAYSVSALAAMVLGCTCASAQVPALTPDLATIAVGSAWSVYNATAESVQVDGRQAARLVATGDSANGIVGLALANGVAFTTGTIEVDLKGKDVRGRSFLGVAFNVAGEKAFEGVYFRPFNFKADEPFRGRAVQYIAWPAYTWEKLRRERTGEFEAPIRPLPDPNGWFHVRVEVANDRVRVFVDRALEPCLTTTRLAQAHGRAVGLFVDSADGMYANLRITPDR